MDHEVMKRAEFDNFFEMHKKYYEPCTEMPRISMRGDILQIEFCEPAHINDMPEVNYDNVEVFLPDCLLDTAVFRGNTFTPKAIWYRGENIVDYICYEKGEYYWDDTYNSTPYSTAAILDGWVITRQVIDRYDSSMPYHRGRSF